MYMAGDGNNANAYEGNALRYASSHIGSYRDNIDVVIMRYGKLYNDDPNTSENESIYGSTDDRCYYYTIENGELVIQEELEDTDPKTNDDVDMGDVITLEKFIDYGMRLEPAKNYLLFIGGHGFGVDGIFSRHYLFLPILIILSVEQSIVVIHKSLSSYLSILIIYLKIAIVFLNVVRESLPNDIIIITRKNNFFILNPPYFIFYYLLDSKIKNKSAFLSNNF